MKKVIAVILSVLLVISLAACGNTNSKTPVSYVPSEDIEVAVAFVNEGKAKVVTRKTSDKELKSIDLACVYYTADGKAGNAEKIQCDFSTEGTLSIWTFTAQANSAYVDAVIASVTYADGSEKACTGVETWISEAKQGFSQDAYNKKMEEMAKKEGADAEKCDAAEITLGAPAEGALELGVKNTSGKEIKEVVAYLLWFDEEGKPVSMNGVLVPNSEKISAKTLAVDEDASYTATAPSSAASVKGVVQSVTFADDTVWENNYIYEWAITNYESAE